MSSQGKSFEKVTFGVHLFMNTKEACFFVLKNAFRRASNNHFLICLIDNGFKQLQPFEQFSKVRT
jgi:hypothetical protein